MTKRKLYTKKCDRCGHVRKNCSIAERACWQRERNSKGFTTGYRCGGVMRTVVRRRKTKPIVPIPKGVGLGIVLSEEYQAEVSKRLGEAARTKSAKALVRVRAKLEEWRAEQRRIGNLVKKWEKQERRHEARVAWTDEQFKAERERAGKAAQVSRVKRRLSKSIEKEEQDDQ